MMVLDAFWQYSLFLSLALNDSTTTHGEVRGLRGDPRHVKQCLLEALNMEVHIFTGLDALDVIGILSISSSSYSDMLQVLTLWHIIELINTLT